ncbi:hypothetical protein B0T11DRAFT_329600 [Plectosphaerella cucumerina]|uniref:Uncharacterized protein n=1 Tax=Plectosphaerella cucumerina TaxID=40658 RepID=A0A8K0X2F6_9PEZI|nr:hypothetical protein B0T11DRAFT_329600 [Plectosphaerella cucumerina]
MSTPDDYSQPTARWPVMEGDMIKLLQAYRGEPGDEPSAYRLWMALPRLIQPFTSLGSRHNFDTRRTAKALGSASQHEVLELLWAIPPRMLLSILRQTVAVDFHNRGVLIAAELDAPGIYVVTVEIEGRQGLFLNSEETELILQRLDQYKAAFPFINAVVTQTKNFPANGKSAASELEKLKMIGSFVKAWNKVSGRPPIPQTNKVTKEVVKAINEVATVIDKIDGINSTKKRWDWRTRGCRFCPILSKGTSGPEVIQRLSDMLRRRVFKGASGHRERAGQSPQYIGCSSDLKGRTGRYAATQSRDQSNKHLQIMLGVLDCINIDASLKTRVVLRTWKREQLPIAEALVVALGRSIVWQDGFNSEEGGGQSTSAAAPLFHANTFVKGSVWFGLNVERTSDEAKMVIEKRDKMADAMSETNRLVQSMEDSRDKLQQAAKQYPDLAERVCNQVEATEKRWVEAKKATRLLGNLCDVYTIALKELGELPDDFDAALPDSTGLDPDES